MSKTVNTTAHDALNTILADAANLKHLLDSACMAMCEMDFGNGSTRNHELDRVNGLVDVARSVSEALEQRLDDAYPSLAGIEPAAVVSTGAMPAVPEMDFTGWSILDFELAMDGWIRMEHAITGVINMPRAMADHGRDYRPGAAYFRDFMEDWADFQMNRIVKHLRTTRFSTVEEEQRRIWLIVKFTAEYPDEIEDLLVFATSQLQASK